MTKKIIIAVIALFSILCVSTYASAENDMQKAGEGVKNAGEGVRNAVGGAENVVENAAKGASNAIKSGFNAAGDATKNVTENVKNGVSDGRNGIAGTVSDNNNNDGYTATKTATGTFAGMNSTVWTWFILAIVALAIIGLVWYYSTQTTNSRSHDDR